MQAYLDWWETYYRDSPQDSWSGKVWASPAVGREGALDEGFEIRLPSADQPNYYAQFQGTPFANDYLLSFARASIRGQSLGRNPAQVTDLLFLSLSTHDYLNHGLGPDSAQSLDNILQMDRSPSDFFDFIDEWVGLERALWVLTADHGFGSNPEHLRQTGLEAGRIRSADMEQQLNDRLAAAFGPGSYVEGFYNPTLYLNRRTIEGGGLDFRLVEEKAAEFLRSYPGIAKVFTRRQFLDGTLPEIPFAKAAQFSWQPRLSGDLFLIARSGWFLLRGGDQLSATHGSPYTYDTDVPLMFFGPWIKPGKRGDQAYVSDLAPTLAYVLGIRSPSASAGRVLVEVLERE